jgi:hypothetical protein
MTRCAGHAAQRVIKKHSRRLQCEVCNAHIAIVEANGAHLVTIASSSGFVEFTLFGSFWLSHGLKRKNAPKRAKTHAYILSKIHLVVSTRMDVRIIRQRTFC